MTRITVQEVMAKMAVDLGGLPAAQTDAADDAVSQAYLKANKGRAGKPITFVNPFGDNLPGEVSKNKVVQKMRDTYAKTGKAPGGYNTERAEKEERNRRSVAAVPKSRSTTSTGVSAGGYVANNNRSAPGTFKPKMNIVPPAADEYASFEPQMSIAPPAADEYASFEHPMSMAPAAPKKRPPITYGSDNGPRVVVGPSGYPEYVFDPQQQLPTPSIRKGPSLR